MGSELCIRDRHYGETNGAHIPHDSGLSVGSMGDAAKVRQLEEEVRELADRANGACTSHLIAGCSSTCS